MKGIAVFGLLACVGCGAGGSGEVDGGVRRGDADAAAIDAARSRADAAPGDASPACSRSLPPANRPRKVIVSHPFDEGGDHAPVYEVLDLAADGTLTAGGPRFEMGTATQGVIDLSADGSIGAIAQNDGTVGLFRIDEAGAVQVVEPAFAGDFYADKVRFDPDNSQRLYILDNEFRASGGGIYVAQLGCEGAIASVRMVAPAKRPGGLLFLSGGRALLAARDVLDSPTDRDAHLLTWSEAPQVEASADAFDDDDSIVSAVALTADERYMLVGDNSAFAAAPNRIGVLAIGDGSLTPVHVVQPIEDPFAIAVSPFGGTAIVVSGYGDAIYELSIDPDANPRGPPAQLVGQLTYTGPRPQLPGDAVMIRRGDLTGLVLVVETSGVRRVRFSAAGTADLGLTETGQRLSDIVGAIGVQP